MAGFSFGTKKTGSWGVAQSILSEARKGFPAKIRLAVKRAALTTEREMKKGIRAGAPGGQPFDPLAASTILTRRRGRGRGSAKPLLDQGSLLGSITTTIGGGGAEAFVGVHRTARSADGDQLFNVALVHEFGTGPFVIQVTDAMRKFFVALFYATKGRIRPLSPNKTTIMHPGIPKRPFVRPTFKAVEPKVREAVEVVLAKGF